MHAISFGVKRAHLRAVRLGKSVMKKKARGVTPARYDLLFAIRGRHRATPIQRLLVQLEMPAFVMRQDVLRHVLGLHHTTVSLMIKRLVALGWVTKSVCSADRRTNVIALTLVGLRKIDHAIRIVYQQRTHMLPFEKMLKVWAPAEPTLLAIDCFLGRLKRLGRALGDQSRLQFDFGLSGGD